MAAFANTWANSVSILKTIDTASTSNVVIEVLGYYAPGDGGGGMFYFDSASSKTADEGTVVSPNSGSGRWIRIMKDHIHNIRWYGAKGDDSTNDTSVFNTALSNYANTIYIPTGNYRIGDVTVDREAFIFGNKTSVIKASTDGVTRNFLVNSDNVRFENLTFTGNTSLQPARGIQINTNKRNVKINDCVIKNGERCIEVLEGCNEIEITDNVISNNVQAVVMRVKGGNNIAIKNNIFKNNDGIGVLFDEDTVNTSNNIIIDGNIFANNVNGRALLVDYSSAKRISILNNIFNDELDVGSLELRISTTGTHAESLQQHILVSKNQFYSNTGTDLALEIDGNSATDRVENVTISDNLFTARVYNSGFDGISMDQAKNINIIGNQFKNIGRSIFVDTNCFDINVIGNRFENSQAFRTDTDSLSANIVIADNEIYGGGTLQSINIDTKTSNVVIRDNTMVNDGIESIIIRDNTENIHILNNFIKTGNIGIEWFERNDQHSNNVIIKGNHIIAASSNGIDFNDAINLANVVIEDNFFETKNEAITSAAATVQKLHVIGNTSRRFATNDVFFANTTSLNNVNTFISNVRLLDSQNTAPTSGVGGTVGEIIYNTTPIPGDYFGWVVTSNTSPTSFTWKGFGSVEA